MTLSMATGVQPGLTGVPVLVKVGDGPGGAPDVAGSGEGEALLDGVGSGDGELADIGVPSSVAGAAQDARMDENNARI